MFFSQAQEYIAKAATLISQRRLEGASVILMDALRSLQEAKFATSPTNTPQVADIVALPVSEGRIACCRWDEQFFVSPLAVFHQLPRPAYSNFNTLMTEQVGLVCAATCLYLMGLANHLRAHKTNQNCEDSLRTSSLFYGHAWMTLKKLTSSDDEMGGLQFLRMAICSNLAHAMHQTGEVSAANAWLVALQDVLKATQLDQDEVSCEIYEFFLLTSTVNTGFVAAGAA
mmetsp:Transcript_26661/g.61234  ORF Transcript_26661/g.61234 Transcript_26661/m.61234 type:complete len:228 (+) Transcript_26661:104-787(+)